MNVSTLHGSAAESLTKASLSSLNMQQLTEMVKSYGQPAFRAKEIFAWLHSKQAENIQAMTSLPLDFRAQLAQNWVVDAPAVVRKLVSSDGTIKYLMQLADGNCVETVLMRYNHGNSLCISSQVGCRMGCKFCASAPGGLVRNLTAGEMLGQVYAAERDSESRVASIVLMGIGEPLDNMSNVLDFITTITDEKGHNLSGRGITLSTCGLVPQIRELAQHKLGITLSISLHAAGDKARSALMPVNHSYPLGELLAACRYYQKATGRRVSFEYAMVQGVNDTPADAEKLAALLKGMGAHVNLIPINPVESSGYEATQGAQVASFQKQLQVLGLNATTRRRLGADINAACGQLRMQTQVEPLAGEENA